MRKLTYLFIIALCILSGCLEEFEPKSSSFKKIYGTNLFSYIDGVVPTNDDGFVVWGRFHKSTQGGSGRSGEVVTILKTTNLGYTEWERTVDINEITFKNHPYVKGWTAPATSIPFIYSIVNLENGNYLLSGKVVFAFEFHVPIYLILDGRGNSIELGTFGDLRGDPAYDLYDNDTILMNRHIPWLYKIPNSSDLIVLYWYSLYDLDKDGYLEYDQRFYSLMRINPADIENPIWYGDYDQFLPTHQRYLYDLKFDENGDIVLVGQEFSNGNACNTIFIQTIDPETGHELDVHEISPENEWNLPAGIVITEDHYVVHNTRTTAGCFLFDPESPPERNSEIGGLRFISKDFAVNFLVDLTEPEIRADVWQSVLETEDGDIVASFYLPTAVSEGVLIVKTNAFGDSIWTYRNSTIRPWLLTESSDGGIVLAGNNDDGWVLLKLSKDGKL